MVIELSIGNSNAFKIKELSYAFYDGSFQWLIDVWFIIDDVKVQNEHEETLYVLMEELVVYLQDYQSLIERTFNEVHIFEDIAQLKLSQSFQCLLLTSIVYELLESIRDSFGYFILSTLSTDFCLPLIDF